MYGCGTEGLALYDVSDMKVTNSTIYECTLSIMHMYGGRNIAFENCAFRDNQEYYLVSVFGTENVTFLNCEFTFNSGQQMFNVNDTTISVSNSAFRGNNTDVPIQCSVNVKFINCVFD